MWSAGFSAVALSAPLTNAIPVSDHISLFAVLYAVLLLLIWQYKRARTWRAAANSTGRLQRAEATVIELERELQQRPVRVATIDQRPATPASEPTPQGNVIEFGPTLARHLPAIGQRLLTADTAGRISRNTLRGIIGRADVAQLQTTLRRYDLAYDHGKNVLLSAAGRQWFATLTAPPQDSANANATAPTLEEPTNANANANEIGVEHIIGELVEEGEIELA